MQVFVQTAFISDTENTPVIATYEDAVIIAADAHAGGTLFRFTSGKHLTFSSGGMQALLPSWRDDLNTVINFEANRRVEIPFPDFKQRNATHKTQQYGAMYGMDRNQWPPDAVAAQAEFDRGWTYVDQVRATAANLQTSKPLNPCEPSLWPPIIPPVQIPGV